MKSLLSICLTLLVTTAINGAAKQLDLPQLLHQGGKTCLR
jgi:hypothetical protein